MLSDFHDSISEQKWYLATRFIIQDKCNPDEKGLSGSSAKELAAPTINKITEFKNQWFSLHCTPLEYELFRESQYQERGEIPSIKALVSLGANVNQKNEKGNNALMHYLTTAVSAHTKLSLKIVKFLISKGADFSSNNNQENPIDYAKLHFGEALAQYMQKQVPVDAETGRLIRIQRACRKFLYQQQKTDQPRPAEEIAKTFLLHPMLTLQPKIPLADNSIDPIRASEWVNLHTQTDQSLAKEVLKKIDHVSFERFMFGLKQTIEKWNEFIMSQPPSSRNYALLIDHRAEKSSQWVTSLALPYLAHPPSQTILMNENELKNVNEDVRHLVIFDDATYSGNQMVMLLNALLTIRACPGYQNMLTKELHFIAPFMSESGKKRLSEYEVNIIHHETMPDFNNEGLKIKGQTATYFAHKIAQAGISTINILTTGETIRGEPGVPFIPCTKEPYKSTSNSG